MELAIVDTVLLCGCVGYKKILSSSVPHVPVCLEQPTQDHS